MPTQTADRNSTARPATMKGRHCCANNPVKYVDPTGMFDDEAEANKFHQRAVKKYGSERVGDVRLAAGGNNSALTAIRVAKTAIDATNVVVGSHGMIKKDIKTFGAMSTVLSSVSTGNNAKKIKK